MASSKPALKTLPAKDVQDFRKALNSFLAKCDEKGRKWADARWGVYAFYDYEGEPIYVDQTKEKLRVRVKRHLTNQRTDAVAMRILDLFEVAEVAIYPLWQYQDLTDKKQPGYTDAVEVLNRLEYSLYLDSISNSRFRAILNEQIPKCMPVIPLPEFSRGALISEEDRKARNHPDIRIERRAATISRLAAVARERGEVSEGLRRVLVIQAVRLAYLASQRLAYVEGREPPTPDVIDMKALVGNVLVNLADSTTDEATQR